MGVDAGAAAEEDAAALAAVGAAEAEAAEAAEAALFADFFAALAAAALFADFFAALAAAALAVVEAVAAVAVAVAGFTGVTPGIPITLALLELTVDALQSTSYALSPDFFTVHVTIYSIVGKTSRRSAYQTAHTLRHKHRQSAHYDAIPKRRGAPRAHPCRYLRRTDKVRILGQFGQEGKIKRWDHLRHII